MREFHAPRARNECALATLIALRSQPLKLIVRRRLPITDVVMKEPPFR